HRIAAGERHPGDGGVERIELVMDSGGGEPYAVLANLVGEDCIQRIAPAASVIAVAEPYEERGCADHTTLALEHRAEDLDNGEGLAGPAHRRLLLVRQVSDRDLGVRPGRLVEADGNDLGQLSAQFS